jgi:adenosylhomocysteinase
MGYGPIGEAVARALEARGAEVTIWDPDPEARARAIADGFAAPDSREEALKDKHLAIGGSGHRSLTQEDFKLLAHECVVASASSRDIEVELDANHDPNVEVVPLLASGRGDRRFITRVWRYEDKDVVLLRNGFPINFYGGFETGSDEEIAPTRAGMLLGAAQALRETKPGLHAADLEPQQKVAQALGKELPE